jgi:competence protein ComEC
MRYEPLVLLTGALAAGIALDRWLGLGWLAWTMGGAGMLVVWNVLFALRCDRAASVAVLAMVAACGGAWHHDRWSLIEDDHLVTRIREAAQPICVEAVVLQSPRIVPAPPATPLRPIPLGDRSRCEVEVVAVRDGDRWQAASGRARLSIDGHLLGVQAGDTVRSFALYQRPTPALNPGEFDFAIYERSERRWCQLSAESPECVEVVRRGAWYDPRSWLDRVRLGGDLQLRTFLSPQRAALAAAVMLGEREYLDADRNERFLVTGTVHLLAISGLNLAILVTVFWVLGRTGALSRRGTLAAAIAFVVIYALLTDAQPPVLRAAVLISLFCLARWSGKPVSPWNVLAAAALVVLAWNPTWLFHVGAQLSFLAVAVLAWFQPLLSEQGPADPLDRLILSARPWWWRALRRFGQTAWQVTLTGGVVWLLSFPLVWRYYNLVSPVGLVLNPIVSLPMTFALFSGLCVLLLGWIAPPLAALAGYGCDGSLWLLEEAIARFAPLPHGFAWLPAPPYWMIALFYASLALAAAFPMLRVRRSWCCALLAMWTAAAFYTAMPVGSDSDRPLTLTFVSVGHGAAILVELPDGQNLLYDCGRLGSPLSGARPISAVLWSKGVTHLDAVLISHADSDHYNALPELLDRFSVGVVYVSTAMWNSSSPGLTRLRESIESRSIPIRSLVAGDHLRTHDKGATRLEVLHPPYGGLFGNDNVNSIVLLVEHDGRRALLTGDLEARGLSDLMAEPAIDVDVLMAPHHGSTRSNPRGLAEWCRPEFVVISGSRDFELGRDSAVVAKAFYSAGANVFHTAEHGSIEFRLEKHAIQAWPHRRPPEVDHDGVYFAESSLFR